MTTMTISTTTRSPIRPMSLPQQLEYVDLATPLSGRVDQVKQWFQPRQHLLYVGQSLFHGWRRLSLGGHWRYYSPVHT